MRAFRAEQIFAFVGQVLDGNASGAKEILEGLVARYTVWMTRDLGEAKSWLRSIARRNERTGLVASSGATDFVLKAST